MLPLATSTWDEKEQEALYSVIQSGMFSMGCHVNEFETQFAEYLGSKYCVMVNSGSSANLLAVASLFFKKHNPLKAGDEVIVPAVSWSTTYYPLQQYGLKLKFVDVDPFTMNLDLGKLEYALSEKTRAVFAVNLLGNPLDYSHLNKLIENLDILLIEDNCESLGATFQGKPAGSFGKLGTFSSFFSHHISTMEGGLVVTDDRELFHIMLSIRSHGWTRHLPDANDICEKSNNPFYESFRFVLPGYNLRPLDMCGAVGKEQLHKLDSIIQGRRKNAGVFQALFGSLDGIRIQSEVGQSSWFGFAMVLTRGNRSELLDILNRNGVETRPIVAGNFTRNPVIKYFDYEVFDTLTHSDDLSDNGFFIGNHHYDISDALSKVKELCKGYLKSCR